jgi:hypothetical protein
MSATVQTAVQLNISTGTGGATVSESTSTGLFTLAFGNVNGLGINTDSRRYRGCKCLGRALQDTNSPVRHLP